MSRAARYFTPAEVKEMVELLAQGESTERIGQRQTPPASGRVIGRVLSARLGDLRAFKARARVKRSLERGRLRHLDYREGFEAGYRMALTHVNLHGLEEAREYCNGSLLPWRETGLDDIPPEFPRVYRRRA